jgi:hypothetical protein
MKKLYVVIEEQPTQGDYIHGVFDDYDVAIDLVIKVQKETVMDVFVDEFILNKVR